MTRSMLDDAFGHHVWATQRLIDACMPLRDEQLETAAPGTYGSIMGTMRHLVGSDSWYLFDITGDRSHRIDEKRMGLAELRAAMGVDGRSWSRLLAQDPDPETIVREVDEADGFQRDAPIGLRLAQALHHGTDHRSQICTALTTIGVAPPSIDVWAFGLQAGRSRDPPPA
jgi:uncharacterized damage-inducible protein DinB